MNYIVIAHNGQGGVDSELYNNGQQIARGQIMNYTVIVNKKQGAVSELYNDCQ